MSTPQFPCWMWNSRDRQWYFFHRDTGLIRLWQYTHWQKEKPEAIDAAPDAQGGGL